MSNNVPVPYADRPGLVYIEDNRVITTSLKIATLADVEQLIDEKLSQIRALPPPDDEPKQPYYALVERFLAEHVESAQGIITAAEVYNAFLAWCWNNSYLPLPKNSFGRAMTACGVERYRTASFKAYQGIKIKGE